MQEFFMNVFQLRNDRSISNSYCACKAGLSKRGCKHVAAVCIYVNEECTTSKTDQPLIWNKPSDLQLVKYKKGCNINSLVSQNIAAPDKCYSIDESEHVPELIMSLECSFAKYLQTEKLTQSERAFHRQEKEKCLRELRFVCEELFKFQTGVTYHSYECLSHDKGFKIILKRIECPEKLQNLYKNVQVTKDEWIRICIESESQSECFQWFNERFKRITCSKKAHQIKTRKHNFEKLAIQFKNDKFHGTMTADMAYGLQTEPIARNCFCNSTGLKVYTIGLVIKIAQPFLATSPDGIILEDKSLLEIKCPVTCKNSIIVDRESNTSNVPYLFFNSKGKIELKKSHIYFTQIQVSMYVTGLTKCHFFVYSKNDNVHLEIQRDELFLVQYVPKMEEFYFKYLLPKLA